MTIAANRRMTLLEYLNYDDGTDTRYELVNGVLVEMGADSTINTQIAVFLLLCFAQLNRACCMGVEAMPELGFNHFCAKHVQGNLVKYLKTLAPPWGTIEGNY